jgi:hypothetical protein
MKKTVRFYFIPVLVSICCWQCNFFRPEKRIDIVGTVVSLVPPENFVRAEHLTGIWNQKLRATIIVAEIPRKFGVASQEVKKDDTLRGGLKVLSEQKVEVDNRIGILYHLNRRNPPNNFNQWMLVLPNLNYTTAVSGTYPAADEDKLSVAIKRAILTTQIAGDESKLIQSVPFEVNLEKPSLKLAKVLKGPSLVYTADGIWSDSSMFATSFYIGPSYPLKNAIADKENFAKENFKKICSACLLDTSSVNSVMIDSLKGFEVWGYTNNNHKLKYQVILFDEICYYLLVGTAIQDQQKNLQQFQRISRTFRKKNPSMLTGKENFLKTGIL